MSDDDNTKHRIRWSTSQCYVVLLVCLLLCIFGPFPTCHADQDTTTSGTSANTATNEDETSNKKEFSGFKIDPAIFDENADWGTFYDPQNIFCGKYDCYKILGFDYWTFYEKLPTTKDITKAYRALSRHWHPDKNRKKGAKERFVVRCCLVRTFVVFFLLKVMPGCPQLFIFCVAPFYLFRKLHEHTRN